MGINKPSAYKTPVNNLDARLYLVRHGDTDLNSGSSQTERFRGWGDPSLNEKGINSAHEAGQFLADKGILHIFHTDLSRGAQTAEIIKAHTGAETTPMFGLRPWNMGDLTGQPVEPNLKQVNEYQNKTPDKPLPGGESFNEFKERWHSTLQMLVQFSQQNQKPIAVVTHSRNLNELKAQYEGRSMKVKSEQPPGGIMKMDVGEGRVHLKDEDASEGMRDETKPQE